MAASRHKLSIATTGVEPPFVRLQQGLDGNEVTIKNKTAANLNEGSLITSQKQDILISTLQPKIHYFQKKKKNVLQQKTRSVFCNIKQETRRTRGCSQINFQRLDGDHFLGGCSQDNFLLSVTGRAHNLFDDDI